MASPEWPKWEFKDGRKRMTLPIVDSRKDGEGDTTTPKRPNSTESAMEKTRSDRENGMTTPRPIRPNSTESAMKKAKIDGENASTSAFGFSHRQNRKSSKKGIGGWISKESTQREIRARRSIDTSRSETLPDTVPEKKSTVGGGSSKEMKKRSETPLRALENVMSGGKNDEMNLPNLPDPLSELMLERDESLRRENEVVKKRRLDQAEKSAAAAAAPKDACSKVVGGGMSTTPRPPKPRKPSLFSKKKTPALLRRASLESTVPPEWSTVERKEDTVVDCVEKSTGARKPSVSFGAMRDDFKPAAKKEGKGGEGGSVKVIRRSTDGGASTNWITPSLQDFRPSSKQSRKSNESAKEKEAAVLVRRESTSVVPATPMGSEKEGGGGGGEARRISTDSSRLVSPCASDFIPAKGMRKKSAARSPYFGEKIEEKKDEGEKGKKVNPEKQLSWGRLASAIYRKTSVNTEVSIGSTIPGEFEEEEVEMEREKERMNSIASLKSDKSEEDAKKNPVVNRFISSISLATTKGPSSTCSVVKDSLEEDDDEKPNDGFKAVVIDDDSQPDEFEIKDTVQEGAPKTIRFTKPSGLGLFRRPILPHQRVEDRSFTFSPPPPSRQSSGGSIASANPRGRRQIGVCYEDKLSKQLEKALCLRRTDRTLLKHDNSSVTSIVLTVEEDRSSGWGVSLVSHSRGHVLLPGNTAPPKGSCVRVVLPLQCVLDSVAVSPTVL